METPKRQLGTSQGRNKIRERVTTDGNNKITALKRTPFIVLHNSWIICIRTSCAVGRQHVVANPVNIHETFRHGPYVKFPVRELGDASNGVPHLDLIPCSCVKRLWDGELVGVKNMSIWHRYTTLRICYQRTTGNFLSLGPFKYISEA